MSEKVVVTGMGIVSPLGKGIARNWQNLTEPSSGLRPPSPASPREKAGPALAHRQVGEGVHAAGEGIFCAKKLAEKSSLEALQAAGLWDGQSLQGVDPERIGCTVSASKPLFHASHLAPLPKGDRAHHISYIAPSPASLREGGDSTGEAFMVSPPEVVNRYVVHRFGLRGESRNVIAACATGAYSIALAASWIEQGLCDVVIAGSVEPYPHPLIQAGFQQMGVMSPEGVTRPFDRHRSGFTFGEGAGVVVLESESHATGRQAKVLARLSGWALGSDSHSAVAFNSNGAKISGVIERALDRGRLSPSHIRHVNAHGTATRLNDWIETQALLKSFGKDAAKLMISATKASTGHLLGASGSVEFIFTVLALRHQFIPPTATLEEADPECPLDYTPRVGHRASLDHALSLSFGFGGPIGALVVSAC